MQLILECISLTAIGGPVAIQVILFCPGHLHVLGKSNVVHDRAHQAIAKSSDVPTKQPGSLPGDQPMCRINPSDVSRMQVRSQCVSSSSSSLQSHPLVWKTRQVMFPCTLLDFAYEMIFLRNLLHTGSNSLK